MQTFWQSFIAPHTPLELCALLLGGLFGLFAVIAESNRTGDTRKPWFQRPRQQAFALLLLGSGGSLLIDFRDLASEPKFDKGRFAAEFALSGLVSAVFFLTVIATAILLETILLARKSKPFRPAILHLPLTFVADGWRVYQDEKLALLRQTNSGDAAADEAVQTAVLLSQLCLRVLRDLAAADAAGRADLIDAILDAIRTTALRRARTRQSALDINYLAARNFSALPIERRGELQFAFGDTSRYRDVLVLRRRLGAPSGPPILIPVDDNIRNPDLLLPGAPELLAEREYTCLSARRGLSYRPGIPKPIRTAIDTYFKRLDKETVLSIRLMARSRAVGVLNIEWRTAHICSDDPGDLDDMVQSLQPFCMVLATVIEKDEHDRPV